MNTRLDFSPNYCIAPGETILELLEEHSMTQQELASKMNLKEESMTELIKGNTFISFEHAEQLQEIFNIPHTFWNNLQKNYDKCLSEKQQLS